MLEKNANSVNVLSYTYSPQTNAPSPDNHDNDDGMDKKKIIIAGSVVAAIVLIILIFGVRNGKCGGKKCCGEDEDTWKTPRGSEMPYTHDDLAEYRKIK